MLELARGRRVTITAFFVAAAAILFVPRPAAAQLHWDASAQVGVMKRFVVEREPGASDVGFGPVGQLTAHLALLPLLHAGAYLGHDISPLPGQGSARNITFMGVRAKAQLPLGSRIRGWGFVGFGYAIVYEQSYSGTFFIARPSGGAQAQEGVVQGAGGSFFDLPFGIGASYKLTKLLHLCTELGARVGFGHVGSVYDAERGPQLSVPNMPNQNVAPAGIDRFALGLTMGVMLDL